jgi:hypothetical protein
MRGYPGSSNHGRIVNVVKLPCQEALPAARFTALPRERRPWTPFGRTRRLEDWRFAMGILPAFLILSALAAVPQRIDVASAASPSLPSYQVRSLRVTVLSTMLTDMAGVGEWGFAALGEACTSFEPATKSWSGPP